MAVGALANGTFFPYLFSIFVPVFFLLLCLRLVVWSQ